MLFGFGAKKEPSVSPSELVRVTRDAVAEGAATSEFPQKVNEEISKNLAAMKLVLYGEPSAPPSKEAALELAHEVLRTDLLVLLLRWLPRPRETVSSGSTRPRSCLPHGLGDPLLPQGGAYSGATGVRLTPS